MTELIEPDGIEDSVAEYTLPNGDDRINAYVEDGRPYVSFMYADYGPDEAELMGRTLIAAASFARRRKQAHDVGCDLTPECPAGTTHMRECLGAYRSQAEVDSGTVPEVAELDRRRREQRFHEAYLRAGGGGPDAA
jgi:hypothetical protein